MTKEQAKKAVDAFRANGFQAEVFERQAQWGLRTIRKSGTGYVTATIMDAADLERESKVKA